MVVSQPSGTTKIKYQNEDDSFESFDGTNNNNSMISESDISDIACKIVRSYKCPEDFFVEIEDIWVRIFFLLLGDIF